MTHNVDTKHLRDVFGNADYSYKNRNKYIVMGSMCTHADGTYTLCYQTILILQPVLIDGKTTRLPNIVSRMYTISNIEPESILGTYIEESLK